MDSFKPIQVGYETLELTRTISFTGNPLLTVPKGTRCRLIKNVAPSATDYKTLGTATVYFEGRVGVRTINGEYLRYVDSPPTTDRLQSRQIAYLKEVITTVADSHHPEQLLPFLERVIEDNFNPHIEDIERVNVTVYLDMQAVMRLDMSIANWENFEPALRLEGAGMVEVSTYKFIGGKRERSDWMIRSYLKNGSVEDRDLKRGVMTLPIKPAGMMIHDDSIVEV